MAGSIRGGPLGGDTCRHLALDLECRTLGAGLEEREWGQSEGEATAASMTVTSGQCPAQ